MSAAKAIKLFETDCKPSVFSAELGDSSIYGQREATVHVYPRKRGRGYVWILRGPMDLNNTGAWVKDGGIVRGGFFPAVKVATDQLFAQSRKVLRRMSRKARRGDG